MATERDIEVSALRIVNGERLEGEPGSLGNIGICYCGRERGTLYVVVEVQGPRRTDVEAMLVDTITGYYQRATSSITGALRGAIKEANAVLYDDNKLSMRDQQARAGVYCAVVRPGQDLVLAYAGPSVARLIGPGGGVEHLPSALEQIPLHESEPPALASNALGVFPNIEPYLFSSPFEPGDILLLASPGLLQLDLDDEELANALAEDGIDGLPDQDDVTALLLEYLPQRAPAKIPATEPMPRPTGGRNLAATGQALGQRLVGFLRPTPHPDRPPPEEPIATVPPAPEPAIPAWLDTADKPAKKAGRWRRPSVRMPQWGHARMLAILALAAVLIVAAGAAWQTRAQARAREERFQNLIIQAENKRALGQASLDRSQAVATLTEAQSLVNEALAVKPDAANALALRDSILRDMDETRGVVRLAPSQVAIMASFTAPGTGLARIVGDGFNLYVLDKGDQKVYKFILNAQGTAIEPGGDSILVRKGDQIGGVVIGDLIDIAWIPTGGPRGKGALAVLESGGYLVEYDVTQGLRVLTVRDARTWRKVQATGGYAANFYVLDTLANSILRYRPQGRGYEGPPSPYLQTAVELVNAVDMAIDGDIFVLLVNGQVIWLSGGKPQPFPLERLDRPLSAPVAIFTNEGTESLYVADPANSRLVQISKQGVILQQLVYEDREGSFQQLRGVFVDEKKQSIYVTAGVKLLHITMPR